MPTPRFAVVDSLRGLAALWVLFYHLWMRFYPGLTPRYRPPEFPPDPALVPIGYGYTGVILFFVVSGFCIHFPQAKRFVATGSDQLSLADFTRRRFWRLYPAYFASIVVAVVMARLIPAILLALRGKPFDAAEAFSVGDALANALFLQPLFPESLQLNPVYWTLIYEIQFYAAYPALLWLEPVSEPRFVVYRAQAGSG